MTLRLVIALPGPVPASTPITQKAMVVSYFYVGPLPLACKMVMNCLPFYCLQALAWSCKSSPHWYHLCPWALNGHRTVLIVLHCCHAEICSSVPLLAPRLKSNKSHNGPWALSMQRA